MTDRDALVRRIEALLHHPPERCLTQGFEDEDERKAARDHLGIVGMSSRFESAVDVADHVAAGSNEYDFPKQRQPGSQEGVAPVEWGLRPVLRHPLSGAVVDLQEYLPFTHDFADDGILRQAVDGALGDLLTQLNLRSHINGISDTTDLERLALTLWRLLPDRLAAKQMNVPWPLLPAEPRIPDHSVWEHLSLTAALATAGLGPMSGTATGDWQAGEDQPSTAALLLFTIGPVQGFIGAARKTRDLQAGSFLLSYLTWHAIRCVCEHYGPEAVLFPDLRGQPLVDRWLQKKGVPVESKDSTAATMPNRFFAVVPEGEAAKVAGQAEEAVRDEFACLARQALNELKGKIAARQASCVGWAGYEKQARDYFECYWTVLPLHRFGEHNPTTFQQAFEKEYTGFFEWKDDNANAILGAFSKYDQQPNVGTVYGRLYRLTEVLTGSRKALRNFAFVEESGYRCSLIPSLPALVPADTTDPQGTPGTKAVGDFWKHAARRLKPSLLREGEQLSAVALAKRFLPDYEAQDDTPMPDGRFPSTGSFATADFKADVIAVLTGPMNAQGETDERRAENKQKLKEKLRAFHQALQPLSDAFNELTEAALPKLRNLTAGSVKDDEWERRVKTHDEDLPWFAALDGGWLFADGYDAKQIAKEYGFETANGSDTHRRTEGKKTFTKGQVEAARDALGAFLGAATDASIDWPSKYFAVLQMDGDEMGKWLSGQKAPYFRDALHPDFEKELTRRHEDTNLPEDYEQWVKLIRDNPPRPLTPALHLAISRALGVFALQFVPRLTEEEYLAQRVYSGGDDVLAFASFRDALPLVRRLRAAFSGQITETVNEQEQRRLEVNWNEARSGYVKIDDELLPTMGHTATASTGIVIAHYKHSLQHVFREAHAACEDYAKDHLKRNALAITVLKRSGERFQTGTKWHTTSGKGKGRRIEIELAEALGHYADLVRERWVASGYMYDLEVEAGGLSVFEMERKPDENGVLPPAHEAVKREAHQLFQRRTEALRNPEVERLPRWLQEAGPVTIPDWLAEKPGSEKSDWPARAFAATVLPLLNHNPLDRVISLLDAAQFIGQGGER